MLSSSRPAPPSFSCRPLQPTPAPAWATKDLRAGIIGTDTSHVPAFTKTFRDHPEWRIKVVAAFKGGSPDFPISANRVDGFAKTIQNELRRRARRQHRRAPRQGGRRPARKRGRAAAPRAGDAGAEGAASACSSTSRSPPASRTRAGSRRWRKRRARRSSAAPPSAFIPDIPKMRDIKSIGKVTRVQANYQLNMRAVPPRPLLLRHPRRRGALRGDGAGLHDADAQGRGRQRRHHLHLEGRTGRRLQRAARRRSRSSRSWS